MKQARIVVVFCAVMVTVCGSSVAAMPPAPAEKPAETRTPDGEAAAFDPCVCDLDRDHAVGLSDIANFASDYHSGLAPKRSDFNRDGLVNLVDMVRFAQAYGTTGCP